MLWLIHTRGSNKKEVNVLANRSYFILNSITEYDIAIWHKRLGHVSNYLKELFLISANDISNTLKKCTICPCAKQVTFLFMLIILKDYLVSI